MKPGVENTSVIQVFLWGAGIVTKKVDSIDGHEKLSSDCSGVLLYVTPPPNTHTHAHTPISPAVQMISLLSSYVLP